MSVKNIDINELAAFIFTKNVEEQKVLLHINSLKTTKQLFFLLFDLFCKGLILLYGNNSNRLLLNKLEMSQFEELKRKLKCAHINLILTLYDADTAKLLDMIPDSSGEHHESTIIRSSLDRILKMDDNDDLTEYQFHLYMNDTLFCINFDIMH